MKEKLGIRFLCQFIALCFLRIVLSRGYFFAIGLVMFIELFLLSFVFTLFLESFDRLVVRYVQYERIMILILLVSILLLYKMGSWYLLVVFGYLSIVMIKDIYQISSMQKALKAFQKDYDL